MFPRKFIGKSHAWFTCTCTYNWSSLTTTKDLIAINRSNPAHQYASQYTYRVCIPAEHACTALANFDWHRIKNMASRAAAILSVGFIVAFLATVANCKLYESVEYDHDIGDVSSSSSSEYSASVFFLQLEDARSPTPSPLLSYICSAFINIIYCIINRLNRKAVRNASSPRSLRSLYARSLQSET